MIKLPPSADLKDFGSLLEELRQAEQQLADSKIALSAANSANCTAINRLNNAQKEIDNLLGRIKAASPSDSDWGRLRMKGTVVHFEDKKSE